MYDEDNIGENMTIQPEELRKAMRNWATGIPTVTAAHEGSQHGMTVSSFTSVSLEPPLVSVSLYKTSRTYDLVRAAGHFGVTILAADQEEISNIFAGRVPDTENRLEGLKVETLVSGAPFITGGLSFFDCRVTQEIPLGTNSLFVAEILDLHSGDDGNPLLYFDQKYQKLE